MGDIIEIDGEKWSRNPPPENNKTSRSSSKMMALLGMAMAMGGEIGGLGGATRKVPSGDIVELYRLVRSKQSNLSKWERDWVVGHFESTHTKVEG